MSGHLTAQRGPCVHDTGTRIDEQGEIAASKIADGIQLLVRPAETHR
jgi:hypothetical protein